MQLLHNIQGCNFKLLLGNFWIQHSETCNLTAMQFGQKEQVQTQQYLELLSETHAHLLQLCLGRETHFRVVESKHLTHILCLISTCSKEPTGGCILTRMAVRGTDTRRTLPSMSVGYTDWRLKCRARPSWVCGVFMT